MVADQNHAKNVITISAASYLPLCRHHLFCCQIVEFRCCGGSHGLQLTLWFTLELVMVNIYWWAGMDERMVRDWLFVNVRDCGGNDVEVIRYVLGFEL
jgi:hypothetical protein